MSIHARGLAKGYAAGRQHIQELNRKAAEARAAKKPALTLPPPKNPVAGQPEALPQAEKSLPPVRKPTPAESNLKVTNSEFDNSEVPPGQVRRKIGDVFMWARAEYRVTLISSVRCVAVKVDSSAQSAKEISISTYCDSGDIIRHEENFQQSESGSAASKQINNPDEGSKNKMKATKENLIKNMKAAGKTEDQIAKAVEANYPSKKNSGPKKDLGGLTGSAQYVRSLHAEGLSKTAAQEKAVKKFPILGTSVHFQVRWEMAEKLAKAVKASGKTEAKPAVKKSVLAPKAKAPAKKKPAAENSAPVASVPPPRPATAPEAPVAG